MIPVTCLRSITVITPTSNYECDKDPVHNTTNHVKMLFFAFLAQARVHVKRTLMLIASDPRACTATNGVWDYSQASAQFRRFLSNVTVSQNFAPLNVIPKGKCKEFNV